MRAQTAHNIRTHSKDEAIRLNAGDAADPGQSIAYIQDDELVEVTPKSIRCANASLVRHLAKGQGRSGNEPSSIVFSTRLLNKVRFGL